jgi:hypothetical protein
MTRKSTIHPFPSVMAYLRAIAVGIGCRWRQEPQVQDFLYYARRR